MTEPTPPTMANQRWTDDFIRWAKARERQRVAQHRLLAERLHRDAALAMKAAQRVASLRISVQGAPEHMHYGDPWALNVLMYPEEYRFAFRLGGPGDVRQFSEMKAREIARQIQEVIERCLTGELEEYKKASWK